MRFLKSLKIPALAAAGALALTMAGFGAPIAPAALHVHADGPVTGPPPRTASHPASPKKFALFDLTNECGSPGAVAVATGNTFECDYVTTAQINAGGNLKLTITSPAGTLFALAGVNPGSLPADCAAAVVTNVLTISCALNHGAGLIVEALVVGGPAAPAVANVIMMTAAYNGGAAGPVLSFPYQFQTTIPPSPANVVTQATSTNGLAGTACVDTTRPGFPIFVGDGFSCNANFAGPNSASAVYVDNVGLPAGSATYTLSGEQTDTSGFSYYLCGNPQTNTPCLTATITGTATGPGALNFDLGAANLGAGAFYLPSAIVMATTPGGFGVLPVPPPMPPAPNPPLSGANVCGSSAANAVANGSTFECDLTTTTQINVGDPKGLVINAPAGTMITAAFLNPSGAPTACFVTIAPFGASVTFGGCFNNIPAGTVVQVYLTGTGINPAVTLTGSYNSGATPLSQAEKFQFDSYVPAAEVFASNTENATPTAINCINNTAPGAPLLVSQSFTCTVTYAGNTPSFITVGAGPAGSATFTLTAAGQVTRTNAMVGYQCPTGVLTPASVCTSFSFTATATGTGPLAFQLTNYALGAALPYGAFAASPTSVPPVIGPGAGGAFVYALGGLNNPTISAIGCANSNNVLDIAFGASGGVLTGNNQITTSPPLPTPGSAPGALSFFEPSQLGVALSAVECGAAFQDTAAVGPFFGQDADPNTIPGGTITITLSGGA
ncbi:MAG: hypothetical protein ACYDCQ_11145, partial [Dehalococcoidia bacterium]